MKMIFANIDAGQQLDAPALGTGSSGIGTWAYKFYTVIPLTFTDNLTPGTCGEGIYGTLYMHGTIGTALFTWTPQTDADRYIVYKGTADASGTYMYKYAELNGTIGTWFDPAMAAVGTGVMGSNNLAWTNSIIIPQPDNYTAGFSNTLLTHELANMSTVISNKQLKYNADITYSYIGTAEKYDLMTAFNWHSAMRIYPNAVDNPGVYFNVFWSNDFNFKFVSSNINDGYSGNITLKGIEGLSNVVEVV